MIGFSPYVQSLHEKIVSGKEIPDRAAFKAAAPHLEKHLDGDPKSLLTQEAQAAFKARPIRAAMEAPYENPARTILHGPELDIPAARERIGLVANPKPLIRPHMSAEQPAPASEPRLASLTG